MGNTFDLFSGITGDSVRILFLDTETTGVDPATAEVCEVAFLLAEYNGFSFTGEKQVFETLVKPSIPIPPEASAVNQISNRMVENSPASEEITEQIRKLAEQADYISAHNLPYDHEILSRQYPSVFKRFNKTSQIDTLRLSRQIWQEIPSHAMQALRYRFELDNDIQGEAHRALFDTELVQSLLHFSLEQKCCLELNNDWNALVDFIFSPLEVRIFTFGKYRGTLVEDTVARDPDYIRWLLKQKWLPEEHPDLYHTILTKTGAGK
ncbi:MAG: 3'-5' exonuclease [Candidatus Fermentibacteraceae bacterium]|nr:3'-5' exonuclease [Candidatus Fermentibacteraceae bacterium]